MRRCVIISTGGLERSFDKNLNTKFRGGKLPKEGSQYSCMSKIVIDLVLRINKNYYPQTLLEECKYKIKEGEKKKMFIIDDTENSSTKILIVIRNKKMTKNNNKKTWVAG